MPLISYNAEDDSSEEIGTGKAMVPGNRCSRCETHINKTTKTGVKKPLSQFFCDVGTKSMLRVIRKLLLNKILAHVRANLELEHGKVCAETRFKKGCVRFFAAEVMGAEPKKIVAKRVTELIMYFLDLQCSKKLAFIAAQISNEAGGER